MGSCAALTEADPMSRGDTFQDHLPVLFAGREIVAGHSIPAETPVDGESSGFTYSKERGVLQGQSAGPPIGTLVTEVAQD